MGMFDAAKTVKTKSTAKKATRAEIVIAGMEEVAALDAVIDSLKAIHTTKMAEVKSILRDKFSELGLGERKRPESFRGLENGASASCELRRRSVTSPLSDDEQELCAQFKIPTKVEVETVDTFVINPDYVTDMVMMAKIEKALKGIKGIPEDLFLKQDGKSKTVVDETALDVLFTTGNKGSVETLLPIIGVIAVKPKMNEDDLPRAFEIVEGIMAAANEDTAEAA